MAQPSPCRLHSPDDFAALATLLVKGAGSIGSSYDLARAEGVSIRVQNTLRKAAAIGVITTESGAADDFALTAEGFVESLSNAGAFDQILASARRVPLDRAGLRLSTAITGSTPAEGALKLVSSLDIARGLVARRKSAVLTIATNELLRESAGARTLIDTELRQGLAAAVDEGFVPLLAAAATEVPATGSILPDLGTMLGTLTLGSRSAPVFVLAPARAAALAVAAAAAGISTVRFNGGSIFGADIAVTDALPAAGGSPPGTIEALLVDASRVAAGAEGVTMRTVDGGVAEIIDDEEEVETVALWQRNCTGILVERFWGAAILGDGAVAALVSEEAAT